MPTQSRRFEIAAALAAAVQNAFTGQPVKFRRNPRDPSNVKDGARVVFLEDQSDGRLDGIGQQDKRTYVFSLGVINRGSTPEGDADADHVVAEAALREAALALVRPAGDVGQLRETQTVFKVEGIDVGGALILTTFELDYRRAKPPRP